MKTKLASNQTDINAISILEKIKQFVTLLKEETNLSKKPLELSNESNVITFIISIINDILIYNINGDEKYNNIYNIFKKNLPKHPPLLFIETLNYLSKGSEKLHILLFLEFSKKTMDQFFEKLQQNKEIMKFFLQNKNIFFINFLNHCIEIFRSFKTLNFIVKSAVLDQYIAFLQDLETNNISSLHKYGLPARSNKRASTPNLVLSIFENKYQWNIKAKNSSISPCSDRRQFFAGNRYHKKKNSSFEINAKKCKSIITYHEQEKIKKKSLFQTKIDRIEKQLLKRKTLIGYFKQTHELLKNLNENLNAETKALHLKIKTVLKTTTDQSSISLSNFLPKSNVDQSSFEVILKSSQDSLQHCSNMEEISNGKNEEEFEEFPSHQKHSSRTNKLSFGLNTLSFDRLDFIHNNNNNSNYAVSPKFEGSDSDNSFANMKNLVKSTPIQISEEININPFSRTENNSNSVSFFEEKTILKNSQVLFKEKYETICMKEYKPKPMTKKSLEDQLFICYSCHMNIPKSLIFWNQAYYCNYLGFWYCPNCISKEKRPLWWKAIEEFDLTPFEISNDAKKEIDELITTPNLVLKKSSEIVRSNKKLKDFLVIKKQIHKMYDLICDTTIMLDILQDHSNLALESNLLSLWNLSEINDCSIFRFMEKVFLLITNHISKCKECQNKGIICRICNSPKKIFSFEQKKKKCSKCKTIYHEKCFQQLGCLKCTLPSRKSNFKN